MARFQFFFADTDRQTDGQTDCLTPLRACARGVKILKAVPIPVKGLT